MDIYRFVNRGKERAYKFVVYAENKKQAVSYMQDMQRLFVEQYSRLEQAKLDAASNESPDSQARAQTVVEEAGTLAACVFDFSDDEVKHVANKYHEYLGRQFGAPWCALTVFDAETEEILCDFVLPSTRFAQYPEQVSEEIKQYEEVNNIAVVDIEHFVTDFFKSNPRSKELHDIVKLVRDEQYLYKLYQLAKINEDMLGDETKQLRLLPYSFINDCKKKLEDAIEADPLFAQFTLNSRRHPKYFAVKEAARHQLDRHTRLTPLMYAVDRRTVIGAQTKIAKIHALRSSRLLLDAGADVNARDCWGRTPLMYVVLGKHSLAMYQQTMPGREVLARLLLEYGADPTAKDKQGKSVIDHYIDECEPGDGGENHPAIVLLKRATMLWNWGKRFPDSSFDELHLLELLDKADLMQFIFFLSYEFQAHPEKLQQFPAEQMLFLHRKIEEIKKSDFFPGLEKETQQHFLALPFKVPYPQFLKGMHIKVKDLSASNVANALWLSGKDKAGVYSMKNSFLLWARQQEHKVSEKELDERLGQYQL